MPSQFHLPGQGSSIVEDRFMTRVFGGWVSHDLLILDFVTGGWGSHDQLILFCLRGRLEATKKQRYILLPDFGRAAGAANDKNLIVIL